MKQFYCLMLALGLVLGAGHIARALPYQIRDLGSLPGQTDAFVSGMNDGQEIIGTAYVAGPTTVAHGFYWSEGTGMIDLGAGEARGINNQGEVVGWSNAQSRSYVWSIQSGFTYAPADVIYYKINDAEQIAATDSAGIALLISSGGTSTQIGDNMSLISGLNQQGCVCGGLYPTGPYIWNTQTGFTMLDPLPGDLGRSVLGINDDGIAVGQSSAPDGSYTHSVRWDLTGEHPAALPDLPGCVSSCAYGINNAGVIVGESSTPDRTACVWYTDGTVQNLGYLPGGSWSEADFVNTGGYIAGRSYDGLSTLHAVLWTPVPEPSSILAMVLGLAGVGGIAVRRRK